MASVFQAQGRDRNPVRLIDRALEIRESCLGADHPELVPTLMNFAKVLRNAGEDDRATEMDARAEEIRAAIG